VEERLVALAIDACEIEMRWVVPGQSQQGGRFLVAIDGRELAIVERESYAGVVRSHADPFLVG
jgi:hypothetical protein